MVEIIKQTTLHTSDWEDRQYGTRADARIEHGKDAAVQLTIRAPHRHSMNDSANDTLLCWSGISNGRESMANPARVAAQLGMTAITFDYTGNSFESSLEHDAADGLRIIDMIKNSDFQFIGHSMGSYLATIASARTDKPISQLHLVTPGGYIDQYRSGASPTKCEITKAFSKEAASVAMEAQLELMASALSTDGMRDYILKQRDMRAVIFGSVRNVSHRPSGFVGELRELTNGDTVYDDLELFRSQQQNAFVTLTHGSRDQLVPRRLLLDALDRHEAIRGSLVDKRIPYNGSHGKLQLDGGKLAQHILTTPIPTISPRESSAA